MPIVEQELIILSAYTSLIVLYLVFCGVFVDQCLYFCPVLIFPLYSFDFQILSTPSGLCKPLLVFFSLLF